MTFNDVYRECYFFELFDLFLFLLFECIFILYRMVFEIEKDCKSELVRCERNLNAIFELFQSYCFECIQLIERLKNTVIDLQAFARCPHFFLFVGKTSIFPALLSPTKSAD